MTSGSHVGNLQASQEFPLAIHIARYRRTVRCRGVSGSFPSRTSRSLRLLPAGEREAPQLPPLVRRIRAGGDGRLVRGRSERQGVARGESSRAGPLLARPQCPDGISRRPGEPYSGSYPDDANWSGGSGPRSDLDGSHGGREARGGWRHGWGLGLLLRRSSCDRLQRRRGGISERYVATRHHIWLRARLGTWAADPGTTIPQLRHALSAGAPALGKSPGRDLSPEPARRRIGRPD